MTCSRRSVGPFPVDWKFSHTDRCRQRSTKSDGWIAYRNRRISRRGEWFDISSTTEMRARGDSCPPSLWCNFMRRRPSFILLVLLLARQSIRSIDSWGLTDVNNAWNEVSLTSIDRFLSVSFFAPMALVFCAFEKNRMQKNINSLHIATVYILRKIDPLESSLFIVIY